MAATLAAPGKDTSHAQPKQSQHAVASGRTPSAEAEPHPDSAFARAPEWESGQSEVLAYAVKRVGPDGEARWSGRMTTERLFLRPDGTVAPGPGVRGETDILNAALYLEGDAGAPFSEETVSQFTRAGTFRLVRLEQSLQGWPGTTHRSLDCRPVPPRLRIASSGGEAPRDTTLARWPVYTEEMLFAYLRAIPLRAGYREEMWLQDWGRTGGLQIEARYALIAVRGKEPGVRDMDTWHVTVDRDDDRHSEFWVAASGLHPIVVAHLSDGTEWTLQGISRKKYRTW
jgi:hypothetical protein